MRTVLTAQPTPDEVQFLEDRIYEHNSSVTGIDDGAWLAIFERDDDDRIVAGLCGATWGASAGSTTTRSATGTC